MTTARPTPQVEALLEGLQRPAFDCFLQHTNLPTARAVGIGLRQLAHVVHACPTQGDAIRQVAQACASAPAPPWRAWLQRQGLQR